MQRDNGNERMGQPGSVDALIVTTLTTADRVRLSYTKKYLATSAEAIARYFDPANGGKVEDYKKMTEHVLGLAGTTSKSAGMLYDALLRPEFIAPLLEVPSKEEISSLVGSRRLPAEYDHFKYPVYYYTAEERWNAAVIRAHMEGPAVQLARAYKSKIPLDAIADACQETGRRYHLIAEAMMRKVMTGDIRVHLPVVVRFFEEYGERMLVRPDYLDSIDLINLSSLGGLRGLTHEDKAHTLRSLNIANIVLAAGVTPAAHRLPFKGKDITDDYGEAYAYTRQKAHKLIQGWKKQPDEEREANEVSQYIHFLIDTFIAGIEAQLAEGKKSGTAIVPIYDPDEYFLVQFYVQELIKNNVALAEGQYSRSIQVPGPFDSEYLVAWAVAGTDQEATLRAINKAQPAFHRRVRTLLQKSQENIIPPTGLNRSSKLSDAAMGAIVAYAVPTPWFISREVVRLRQDEAKFKTLQGRVEAARTNCRESNFYLPKRGEYYEVTEDSGSPLYTMGLRRINLTNAPIDNPDNIALVADFIFGHKNGGSVQYRIELNTDYTHVGMEDMSEYARLYLLDHVYRALEHSKHQMEERAKRRHQHKPKGNGQEYSGVIESQAKAQETEEYWMPLEYGKKPDPKKLSNATRSESARRAARLYIHRGKAERAELTDQFTEADQATYSNSDVNTVLFRINRDLRRIQTPGYWICMQRKYPDLAGYSSYMDYLLRNHKNVHDLIDKWAKNIKKRPEGDDIFDTDRVRNHVLYTNQLSETIGVPQDVSPYYLVQYVIPKNAPTVRRKIKPKRNIFHFSDESN